MKSVVIRYHGDLNDFLPRQQRYTLITVPCAGHETVKHLVELPGVPHPEIAALLVNGTSVDFSYPIKDGDRIEVYPASMLPGGNLLPLRPPLQSFRFVLDTHLGRLAAYLRMLGFDSLYRNDYDDAELAHLSSTDQRMLLTRDIGLLKRSIVTYGGFVRAIAPEQQLREMVQRFGLHKAVESFQRCIRCNGMTQPVEKAAIYHLLKPKTRQYYHEFRQCQTCGKIYWRGSHYTHMQQLAMRALGGDPPSSAKHPPH